MTNGQKIWEVIEKSIPMIWFITFTVAILYQIFG